MMQPTWLLGPAEWLEIGLFLGFAIVVLSALAYRMGRRGPAPAETPPRRPSPVSGGWLGIPELRLLSLALPLELLWETAQFPLYNVWHQNDWGYILYGLVHCTLGDLLVLLVIYELIAVVRRDRHWYRCCSFTTGAVFTLAGAAYTVYSETVNVRLKGTWGYTELMPIVPVLEVGGMPLLQWLLIPPVLLWLMRLLDRPVAAAAR